MTSGEKYLGIATGTLALITILSAAVQTGLIKGNASADTTSTATITVGTACSLTANVTSAHNATLIPGVYSGTYNNGTNVPYADGIGSTTLTAICNDHAGYAIYAVGYTGNTTNTPGNTTMVGTNTGNTIATGTATSGDTSNWAMKLTKVTDATISYNPNNLTIASDTNGSFSDYHAVPSNYTKVANYTSNTDAAKGSKLTTTYAAYIQPAEVADTYVGQVKYTLVHPNTNDPSSFMINFNANGGTGTMTAQKITRGQATALTSNSFTAPTGMAFNGWNTKIDGTGTSYTNNEQVTNLADAGDTITLYAQWVENTQSSCKSSPYISTVASGITYMQDINSTNKTTVLSSLTTDATYQIKDSRDNETYCVSKLKDGNLWLLDNLALDLTSQAVQEAMYNSTDTKTNASYQTLGYLFGHTTGTASDKYATSAVSTTWNNDTYSGPRIYTALKDSVYANDSLSDDAKTWKYGIHYNYCAVSAGSYCYGNGTSQGTSSGNATQDICPAGWHMPSGNTSGDYNNLYTGNYGYDTAASYRTALHLPLSGNVGSGWPYSQGSNGRWWSTTRSSNYNMYRLFVYASNVSPTNSDYRSYGNSARCLLSS